MKFSRKNILVASTLLGAIGCGGSTSNPKTADRNELAAPNGLMSVTRPSKAGAIELRWSASNAEEDFKGYLVFGTTKPLGDISTKVAFPTGAKTILDRFGVPRCLKNTEFFQAFGFDATDADCGDEVAKTTTGTELGLASEEGTTTDKAKTDTADKAEVLKNFISCAENVDTAESKGKVSLAAKVPTTDMQKCTVTQVFDGTKLVAIAEGVPMTFVVFAVMGSDFDKISWSSNMVEDAASTTLAGFDGTDIVLAAKEFVKIDFTGSGAGLTAAATTPSTCPAGTYCKILGINSSASTPSIYLSRDNTSNSYQQRVFVSVPADSTIELQARGAQTSWEGGTFSASIPGDAPTSAYDHSGVTFAVYGNQVFDFKLTTAGVVNYGKIVFEKVTYAGDKNSAATIKTTIIAQTGNGVKHYFW